MPRFTLVWLQGWASAPEQLSVGGGRLRGACPEQAIGECSKLKVVWGGRLRHCLTLPHSFQKALSSYQHHWRPLTSSLATFRVVPCP